MAHLTALDRRPDRRITAADPTLHRRRDRSADDAATYRHVLSQLDRWCRANGRPTSLNAWVAEEAVRRA